MLTTPKENDRKEEIAGIEIGLVNSKVEEASSDSLPIDALAVGHYVGVKPVAAERSLDKAISAALPGKAANTDGDLVDADLILTQYFERGIIRGELGQPFFLPDPRVNDTDRIIAIAGMGVPGRFGVPELTVLARELCWSLGRLGKRHLATVLIGSGNGNISVPDAIRGWFRGIANALSGSPDDEGRRLTRITFVEYDPRKIEDIEYAIIENRDAMKDKIQIVYKELGEKELGKYEEIGRAWDFQDWKNERARRRRRSASDDDQMATRITVGMERKAYRYAAITENASVPEREVRLDPDLIMEANDELAVALSSKRQGEIGEFLGRLLIPDDLRTTLSTNSPLVMLLDSTMARIHWEMVSRSDSTMSEREATMDSCFGLARGFTRQLRTMFAPPPDPPPPPRRVLRVLVIADPAKDAPLKGALEEGEAVANIFEKFNEIYKDESESSVEVVRMFGPQEATRLKVLRELMMKSYDVLHFAGHCMYDKKNPAYSGWVFTGRKRLTAQELNRIDRIPKFIFSNACESGITPDRSNKRSVDLAPSFAEAFFARGVSNFVCTAWPIEDTAAREFAVELYSNLLGIANKRKPDVMFAAMRKAREKAAASGYGMGTWGAYQHYGNPNFRLFDPATMMRQSYAGKQTAKAKKATPARKRRKAD